MRNLLLVTVLSFGLFACALPEGEQSQPEGAHYSWVKARASGDSAALWALLHPSVKASFEKWLTLEKEALADIEAKYPVSDRAEAIAALAGGERAKLPDAQALFASFVKPAPSALSGFGTVGARIKSSSVGETTAQLKSWGGDEVTLMKGEDGLWYVGLSAEESRSLSFAIERAERNARTVKANLAKLAR